MVATKNATIDGLFSAKAGLALATSNAPISARVDLFNGQSTRSDQGREAGRLTFARLETSNA